MRRICAAFCVVAAIVACADREQTAQADSPAATDSARPTPWRSNSPAPLVLPYVDSGACPFEGCSYRQWKSKKAVDLRAAPALDSAVVFRLPANRWVQAVTGVVITTKAGPVTFRDTVQLHIGGDSVRVTSADTVYVLHGEGEGYVTAWFRGRLTRSVDGTGFSDGTCPLRVGCTGFFVNRPETTWWALIRTDSGRTGWTNTPASFNCTDQLGGDAECVAHQKR